MQVELSPEQIQLRESAREFLAAECPMELVRAVMADPDARADDELWKKIATLGWLGLIVPEVYGGAGLDAVDLAVLLEETGRVLLPAPFFSTAVVGVQALVLAGSEAQRRELLPRIVAGELRLAFGQLEPGGSWAPEETRLQARPTDRGYALAGRKLFVPDGSRAQRILVTARAPEGPTLFLVDAAADGVETRTIDYIDGTRPMSEVVLSDVEIGIDARLGEAGRAGPVVEALHDHARAGLCAEMCGGAQQVLDMSVTYAKTREQFGRPIGSFQAIAHKCADMFVEVESMRSAAYYAAWSLTAEESDAHASACMAKAYCARAYGDVAGQGIQIHGGLGFTWEQDLHLYYKRAKACELAFGGVAWTRELAARVLIDGSRVAIGRADA